MPSYAIYLRKSRADMEAEARGEGETLARHQAQLMELARKRDCNVVKIYREIVSGENIASRPQMQQLLADISDNKYDGVLVMEVERLARGDTIDQGVVAQAFKSTGTKIITPAKVYDPENEFDEEYFEFSLFMSRREYKTIRRRMEAGRLASIKEGNYISPEAPYGYRKTHPEPKVYTLDIVPDEAEVVRLIFDMFLNGKGARAIRTTLNNMGISPKKSPLWETPSIKKILRNPIYTGKVRWQNKASGDTLYNGRHQAIISEEIFWKAQQKRENNPEAKVPNNLEVKNYYHGMLYCKNCGHAMLRRIVSSNGCEYMLCRRNECKGKVVSAAVSEIDEQLILSMKYRLEQLEKSMSEMQNREAEKQPDMKTPILSEITRLKNQREKLYDLLERGIYDENVFLERSSVLSEKIKAAEKRFDEIVDNEEHKLSPQDSADRLKIVIRDFDGANIEEKGRLLHSVIKRIYYSKSIRMCKNKKGNTDLNLEIEYL